MIEVIFAMTENGGIGYKGGLPWDPKIETFLFKSKTMGCTVIVGRKTFLTLPPLQGRKVLVVSKTLPDAYHNIEDAIANSSGRTFIIGGGEIYKEVFTNYRHLISRVHQSIINTDADCDTFAYFPVSYYKCTSQQDFGTFVHYEYEPICMGEIQYLNLLRDVRENGVDSEGRNGMTRSKFGQHLKFDLRDRFPLLTTKKMFFRGIVEELLFFLRGDTDSKILEAKGVNIWKGNTSREFLDKMRFDYPEGEMGPMYGFQWRRFNGDKTNKGVDQLEKVINTIKTDPKSRRILMTTFNPSQVEQGVLYPCHSIIIQFFVEDGYLDMFCYNRSSDLFLGLPFNIASSGILQTLVARWTGLTPRFFNLSLGDCHIYEAHFSAVDEQLKRVPHKFPTLDITGMEDLSFENFKLENYLSHPAIKAEMIA